MNGSNWRSIIRWAVLSFGIIILILMMGRCIRLAKPATPGTPSEATVSPGPSVTPTLTLTPEPIVPSRTPVVTSTPVVNVVTVTVESAPVPVVAAESTVAAPQFPQVWAVDRIGVAGGLEDVTPGLELGLRFGNFTFWRTWADVPQSTELAVWQTVRLGQIGDWGEWPTIKPVIEETIRRHPGSFWLVGNEPDVAWQDDVTAEVYAEAYHDIYKFIRERDPAARIGAGGIALPTPMRLVWLDRVLQHYHELYGEPLPADLWSIHLFVLREEADSWGIGIPPGMTEVSGRLHEIEDHGDIGLMKGYVTDFRSWMADNGYDDVPLAVTEFGILLPEDYGFPPEFVQSYMIEAFEFFRTATAGNGLKSDGDRLVQYAFWYSLYDAGEYKTGDLYDREMIELTPLGKAFIRYVAGLPDPR